MLGGEPSGHIVCRDITTTGDGIIAALQVLRAMVEEGKGLHELLSGLIKFPQKLKNVRVAQRFAPAEEPELQKAIAMANEKLNGLGRGIFEFGEKNEAYADYFTGTSYLALLNQNFTKPVN